MYLSLADHWNVFLILPVWEYSSFVEIAAGLWLN